MTDALYDISPLISPRLAVWPGDTVPTREVLLDLERGDNITLSTVHTTVHAGSHVDAPSHYGARAPSIHEIPLTRYIGSCQVIEVRVDAAERFGASAISVPISTSRVLFSTGTYPDPAVFREDFAAPAPELIGWLAGKGVELIGIDTPSVDLFTSKDLPTHRACLRHDVVILEGIVLTGVPEGTYELIALPLPLVGFDASPVRAVLRPINAID